MRQRRSLGVMRETDSELLAYVRVKTRFADGDHRGNLKVYADGHVTTDNDRPGALHTAGGRQLRQLLANRATVEEVVDRVRAKRGVKDYNLHWLPECAELVELGAAPPLYAYVGRPFIGVGPGLSGKSWLVGGTFSDVPRTDRGKPKSWIKHVVDGRKAWDGKDLVLNTRPNRVLVNDDGWYVLCDADGSHFSRYDLVRHLDGWLRFGHVLGEGAKLGSKVLDALAFRPVVWCVGLSRTAYVAQAIGALESGTRTMRRDASHTHAERVASAEGDWDRWFTPRNGGVEDGERTSWPYLERRVREHGGAAVVLDPEDTRPLGAQLMDAVGLS